MWAVGLPEGGWGWVEEGWGAAEGFVGTDCPGCEGGDFAKGGEGGGVWFRLGIGIRVWLGLQKSRSMRFLNDCLLLGAFVTLVDQQ